MSDEHKQTDAVRVECIASRTAHAELFSAFEYGEILTFLLTVPDEWKNETAYLRLVRDDDGKELRFTGEKGASSFRFVLDTGGICREDTCRGLFFYEFIVGKRAVCRNEAGSGVILASPDGARSLFQLSVYAEGTNRPTGYEGGIMYQIFPDRFFRSGEVPAREGSLFEEDWYAPVSEYYMPGKKLLNNRFYGGNLRGIVEKLDYLKTLGVTLLYLNPIFKAFSNHRYDTGDYEKVDELLGGDEALDELICEARKRGMGVILDGVFNHTGSDSRYFNKNGGYRELGAYQSKESLYYPWYFFQEYPDRYESWWGIDTLPKLNTAEPSCRNYIEEIVRRYLSKGICGWRLDVVDELKSETVDGIRNASKEVCPGSILYGEVWEDASNKISYSERRRYFTSGQLDGVMNYPLKNAIISYLLERDASFLFYTMRTLYSHYPKAVSDMQMNVLGTHDTERILTVLAGSPEGWRDNEALAHAKLSREQRRVASGRLRLAVLMQMTLPGIPCIYYGDEAGVEGYKDPFNRSTYPWGREDGEILAFYRKYTALRASLPMLKDAYYRGVSHENGVFVYERFNENESLLCVFNLSDNDYTFKTPRPARSLLDGVSVKESILLHDGEAALLYTNNRPENRL